MTLVTVNVAAKGNSGVAVMLYHPKRSNISRIEREAGVKFEHGAVEMITDMTD
ncbi:DEAD-box ATP-dependent RNA helicase 7-like, partial [Trifolium medium]|nr:DEAD-box ATP-dependent RNA helicase 7-like [Trifolium medium]